MIKWAYTKTPGTLYEIYTFGFIFNLLRLAQEKNNVLTKEPNITLTLLKKCKKKSCSFHFQHFLSNLVKRIYFCADNDAQYTIFFGQMLRK